MLRSCSSLMQSSARLSWLEPSIKGMLKTPVVSSQLAFCNCNAKSFSSSARSQSKPSHNPARQLSQDTRQIFSEVPQPIAIVTTAIGKVDRTDLCPTARAITLSSLTCLSLDPVPLITFNVKLPSRALDVMQEAKQLVVNLLLTHTAEHVELARKFSKPMPVLPLEIGPTDSSLDLVFDTRHWAVCQDTRGIPELRHRGSAKLYCTLQQIIRVADHAIVVAEVQGTSASESIEESQALVYRGHHFVKVSREDASTGQSKIDK